MAIHIKKSHEGLLHKNLHVKEGHPISEAKLEKAKHSKDPKVRKRATFAENAKHWHHGGTHKSAKQPHPKTNPGFYDTEPHAPSNKIADKPLVQNASLGNEAPKMVPQHPGQRFGVGAPHSFKHAAHSHGYGHAGAQKVGHMRTSGHPHAHRIGKK